MFDPLINVNRFETIDRVVRELLTPAESVVEVIEGAIRETPSLLLPSESSSGSSMPALIGAHFVTGSEREKEKDGTLGDYTDQCANHFLLANGYSALAENEFLGGVKSASFAYDAPEETSRHLQLERKVFSW